MERLRPLQMQRLRTRQTQRFLLDPETQTFLLDRRTAAAHPMTFALASNTELSAVWPKSNRRTLGAIRERIDPCWHHRRQREAMMIRIAVTPIA